MGDMYEVLKELKGYKHKMPLNTYRTLKGQVLAGDVAGAKRGLEKIKQKTRGGEDNGYRHWQNKTR